MKVLVQEMHLVVMEKDAEIVRLKMQLADELRRTNSFIRLQEENSQLKSQLRRNRNSGDTETTHLRLALEKAH